MKLSDNPCKRDCPKRSPTCHGSCPEYADYRESLDKENELIHKKKAEKRRLDEAERARYKKR